ncbi:uncharacterized protein A4U43_C05F15690 [Asparagus officinalis]|uniref:Uncharacterized protein n=1 Tax=Asparagus officinalis TaxID=4686 RepID=A0A5P1ERW9_ASPOF|nr:uncharacterized protein A4U43_C05F15690 [Asparagus officinalis]
MARIFVSWPFTPSEAEQSTEEDRRSSYTTGGPEGGFPAKTISQVILVGTLPPTIRTDDTSCGFLAILVEKVVVPIISLAIALPWMVLTQQFSRFKKGASPVRLSVAWFVLIAGYDCLRCSNAHYHSVPLPTVA